METKFYTLTDALDYIESLIRAARYEEEIGQQSAEMDGVNYTLSKRDIDRFFDFAILGRGPSKDGKKQPLDIFFGPGWASRTR